MRMEERSLSHTYNEIQNQPRSWERTVPATREQWTRLSERVKVAEDAHFLFIGCGTSLYIAQSAAHAFQEVTGRPATAVPASEVFLSAESTVPGNEPVLAFVISRSGATTEALIAAEYLTRQRENAQVIGITCNSGTALAGRAQHIIELPHASEQSVVMTQSYTSMLLGLQTVAGLIAGDGRLLDELDRLPGLLRTQLSGQEQFARNLGENLDQQRFVYLGLGPNYGLAQEGNLKLKEMTQVPCEAYNPLEFRHGPISTVTEGTALVLLEGVREREYVTSVEADMKRYGAYLAVLSPYGSEHADVALQLPEGLSDVARCVLYLPALQLIAYYRALALGLDPDQPRNLNQVVVLDAG